MFQILFLRDRCLRHAPLVALLFFFLLGALCPFLVWLLSQRWPDTFLNYLKYVYPVMTPMTYSR